MFALRFTFIEMVELMYNISEASYSMLVPDAALYLFFAYDNVNHAR